MTSFDPSLQLVLDLVANRPPATDGVDWARVTRLVESRGLQGLAVATHRVVPFLPRAVAEGLEEAYLRAALRTTLTLEAARRARAALEKADIPVLLYKGAALVEEGIYRDPGARAMDDADLLVPVARAGEAVSVLLNAGFEPWVAWKPGMVEWLDSATFADARAPGGAAIALDLHWRLGYESLRYGQEGDRNGLLWERADRARALPAPEAHLLVIAQHLLKHLHVRVHLPGVLDLVRLAGEIEEWEPIRERLERCPTGRSLALIMEAMRRGFGAPMDLRGAGLEGRPWMTRAAHRLLEPEEILRRSIGGGDRVRGLLLRWLLSGSVSRALGEVRATMLPERQWLRGRYGVGEESREAPRLRLLLRYWTEVGRWLLGRGPSPVSPNQELER